MSKIIMCMDEENQFSIGDTLEEAWKNYRKEYDYCPPEDVCFYEAEEINVQIKLEKIEIPVKSK